jgi:magnesium-transporting ATPase (P-type)
MTSNHTINPKQIFNKCIEQKPKTREYAWLQSFFTVWSIFCLILISGLIVGTNLLEGLQDSQNHNELTKYTGKNFDFAFSSKIIGKQIQQVVSDQFVEYQKFDISLEFLLIAIVLTAIAYFAYRNTDWPFVKNKVFLVSIIFCAILFTGTLFLSVFQKNSKIPRTLRSYRDNIRELVGQKTFPID